MNHSVMLSTLLLFVVFLLLSENVVVGAAKHETTTTTKEQERQRQVQEEDHPLMGGFKEVKDLNDPIITEAAGFVLQVLLGEQTTDIAVPSSYTFAKPPSSISDYKIIHAWEQVVAGLNIQLTMAFQNSNDDCVGGCSVTIYNHFGELSVTNWNKQVTCGEAKALMVEEEQEEGDEGDET
jgi:hypothetical protein